MGLTVLVVPALLCILVFGHQRNTAVGRKMLDDEVKRVQKSSIKMADMLIEPVAATLKLVAEVAVKNPGLFRAEESRELLYQALNSAQQIDAIYVSYEDGYHRVVTRIDSDRRRSDPLIPASANWHASFLEPFINGDPSIPRRRYRSFFDRWPNLIGRLEVEQTVDIRALRHYQQARESRGLVVNQPTINPDTGAPVISLGYPIFRDSRFVGFVGANITLQTLSEFLAANQVSQNSLTLIADSHGRIIVHPDPEKGIIKVGDGPNDIDFVNLVDNSEPRIRDSARHRLETGQSSFYLATTVGEELSVSFQDFLPHLGRPWQLVVLAPTEDAIGPLRATNRALVAMISGLLALELLFIYLLSRSMASRVENVTLQLKEIQNLSFVSVESRSSRIKEISDLQSGVSLLRNALQTFSQYVPLSLVRQLVDSRSPLGLGVESRTLSIFFADLENFSTYSQILPPEEFLKQVSAYFSAVTEAISQEHGTVDKFIGDAVMAFWGAPLPMHNHVLRACAAALRALRRLHQLNHQWSLQDMPTLKIRIGLNTASVLVGNVGSAERLSYTAMGDGVNVAARLEGVNKEFGSSICISDSVFDAVSEHVVARPLGPVSVKGRRGFFPVYELLGLKNTKDPELMAGSGDLEKVSFAQRAVTAFMNGQVAAARSICKEALACFPDDAVARAMFNRFSADPSAVIRSNS